MAAPTVLFLENIKLPQLYISFLRDKKLPQLYVLFLGEIKFPQLLGDIKLLPTENIVSRRIKAARTVLFLGYLKLSQLYCF